ncbi:MAG: acyl-CoA dehydrogenase [Caulobacteraceae bacterium]|nr:acyl-CoA dehydrogenase [Caulobacteraceae bacterium]
MAALTEEQAMVRDAARDWAREQSPVSALRKLRDSGAELGFDPDAWSAISQMGWPGVVVPEAYGGSDFGYLALGAILEETGRTLTASPLVASALVAASALTLGGSPEQKDRWLRPIASGALIGGLALEEGPRHAPERTALKAEASAGGWRLDGAKTFVLEGMAAGLFVAAARTSGSPGETHGLSLFLIPADAKGLARRRLALMDSRGAASLSFEGVQAGPDQLLGEAGHGWPLLERVLDRGRAGLAAEMLGAATQAFEMTVDYLKIRVQFGQPIGAFQALQHRAAWMHTELELARSAVEAALQGLDDGAPEVPELVSLAKAKMGAVLRLVSNETIQMHGGIGMTDAHDAGLYLKRARVAEAAFGNEAYHRERYARLHGF